MYAYILQQCYEIGSVIMSAFFFNMRNLEIGRLSDLPSATKQAQGRV